MTKQEFDAGSKRFSSRRAWLFALPFILMGLAALVLLLYGVVTRQLNAKAAKQLLTIMVVCAGIPLILIGWFASKRPKLTTLLKSGHPDAPWMWREDWAAGRVVTSVQRSVFFLWVSVLVFNLICLLAVVVVLRGVRYGNQAAWLALIFPAVGLAVLVFAAKTTRTWRTFGRAVFAMTTLPGTPGGVIAGELRVPARLRPEHAFYLRLSCIRRTTTQRKKSLVTTERILWQDEKWFRADLPQTEAATTRLPVFFQTPAGLPASTAGDGDGVQWRLEASAKVSGPDFNGVFEVPVYPPPAGARPSPGAATYERLPAIQLACGFPDGEGALAERNRVPADLQSGAVSGRASADPTLPYQLTLDEVRREIQSRIQLTDKPEGREIIFPAGRNPGFGSVALALWLVWTGAIALMVLMRAPALFPLIFTAVDVLMSLFMLDLWLRRSRVLVTPSQLRLETSWLGFKQVAVLAAGDVASLKAEIGATAGHTAYYDLKIRARNGREYLAAKFLNHKPEADWLLREMAAKLKPARPPTEAPQ